MTTSAIPVLYVRAGCHLCEDAATLLRMLGVSPTMVDVDSVPALTERYGDQVPVLAVGGEAVLSGVLREAAVRAALNLAR